MGDELPGGVCAEIDGSVHAVSRVKGQSYVTLINDGSRRVDRAVAARLFRRTVTGRWRGEPVTVWAARTSDFVRVQYVGDDPSRGRALGMRGDRTVWDLDVLATEVTDIIVDEVDLP